MLTDKPIVALDVGGSSIKSGLVFDNTVYEQKTTPIDSLASKEKIISEFSAIIQGYLKDEIIAGIAFSMPGPFDYEQGISFIEANQNKYGALYGVNLKKQLSEQLSLTCPICFRNDGEAAILGEALFGAGKPFNKLLGITLGTGFGSAFINDGEPQYSGQGIPKDMPLYDCLWQNVRVDNVFSIRGLKKRLGDVGFDGEPKEAAREAKTNQEIKRVFEVWGDELGQFLNKYVASFKAEAVIVQGGLSGAFELFEHSMKKNLEAVVLIQQLGAKAALLGASAKFRK